MKTQSLVTVVLATVVWAGCSSRPKAPDRPALSASAAGAAALKTCDANGDGRISADEAKACPAVKALFASADTDGDKTLTADEIANRASKWFAAGTTIMTAAPLVTLDGNPLTEAEVVFEPAAFLGEGFKECRGTTGSDGRAYLTGADAKFPGVYVGAYNVRITKPVKGKESVPARYNTATELGCEVADDLPGLGAIEFKLSSR